MDKAHEYTDKKIEELYKSIDTIYDSKTKELDRLFNAYFSKFEKEASKKQKELDEKEYRKWLFSICTGREWNKLVKSATKIITGLNKKSAQTMNDAMADVYIENYNYIGKDIEEQVNGILL